MSEIEYSNWFAEKDFSTDWTTSNFATWHHTLADRRDRISSILEIGSWEGRSAIFFLNYFPRSKLTSIDPFGSDEELYRIFDWARFVPEAEARFDRNLAEYERRLEKIKAVSFVGLAQLAIDLRRFDLVYVDGSHTSYNVYTDAAMAWPMLNRGGVMIFDDYEWKGMSKELDCPKLGIDGFLSAQTGQYRELHRAYQVIIEKL